MTLIINALRWVWANLATLPTLLTTLALGVPAVAADFAKLFPSEAAPIIHVGVIIVMVLVLAGTLIYNLTPVVKDLRGLAKPAPWQSKGAQLKQLQADFAKAIDTINALNLASIHAKAFDPTPPSPVIETPTIDVDLPLPASLPSGAAGS